MLLLLAGGMIATLVTASRLHPYDENRRPLSQETHLQLGLPPCAFYATFQRPCPGCGLTTAFSLLMHGDAWNSLRANFVGTLMALACVGMAPWFIEGAVRGRLRGVRAWEPVLLAAMGITAVLLMLRWGGVLLLRI